MHSLTVHLRSPGAERSIRDTPYLGQESSARIARANPIRVAVRGVPRKNRSAQDPAHRLRFLGHFSSGAGSAGRRKSVAGISSPGWPLVHDAECHARPSSRSAHGALRRALFPRVLLADCPS